MYKKQHIYIVITIILTVLTGCNTQQMNDTALEFRQTRHWVPKFMRKQMFYNTPTAALKEVTQMTPYGMVKHKQKSKNQYGGDSYGQGFEDGCNNMTGIIGAGTMRLAKPRFETDRLVNDSWYLRGYQDASSFCTFS